MQSLLTSEKIQSFSGPITNWNPFLVVGSCLFQQGQVFLLQWVNYIEEAVWRDRCLGEADKEIGGEWGENGRGRGEGNRMLVMVVFSKLVVQENWRNRLTFNPFTKKIGLLSWDSYATKSSQLSSLSIFANSSPHSMVFCQRPGVLLFKMCQASFSSPHKGL